MPTDQRMSLDIILSQNSHRHLSPDTISPPKAYPIRPSMHRSGTPRPDPWDLPYPAAMRTNSTYSTYSLYSNASIESNSSHDSNPPPVRIPALSRTGSSDSAFATPSPITPSASPDISLPPLTTPHHYDELAASMALTTMRSMPAKPAAPLSPSFAAAPLARPEPPMRRSSSPRTPRDANGNRLYPCPLAGVYRCDQHFSTSGHARRHSRIHTGERSSECPECGQKFSRQDNMQQHRRTHRTGRDKKTKGRDRCSVLPLSPLVS